MKTEVMKITPAIATKLLEENKQNRILSQRTVDKYVKDMNNGDWKENGESIKIAKDGSLIDGQHRLWAVVTSNKTCKMLVVSELEKNVIDTIDVGKKRSFSDWLSIKGEKNCTNLAAALTVFHNYSEYYSHDIFLTSKSFLTYPELEELLEKNPGMRESAASTNSMKECLKWFTPSVLTVCHYLFAQLNPLMAESFFRSLRDGDNLEKGSPILVLRNTAMKWTIYKQKPKMYAMIAHIIHAWNAYVRGKTLQNIRFNSTDPFPHPISHTKKHTPK